MAGLPGPLIPSCLALAPVTPAAGATAAFRPHWLRSPLCPPGPDRLPRAPPSAPLDHEPVHRLFLSPHGPGTWRTEEGRKQRRPSAPPVPPELGGVGRLWGSCPGPLALQALGQLGPPGGGRSCPGGRLGRCVPSPVRRTEGPCSARPVLLVPDPRVHPWLPRRPQPRPPVCRRNRAAQGPGGRPAGQGWWLQWRDLFLSARLAILPVWGASPTPGPSRGQVCRPAAVCPQAGPGRCWD